ncbi:MAG TPA: hypothetical protein VGC42_08890 [Kofleriaceae bacterium]
MALIRAPRARDTIVYGGLTAGMLDACDAMAFFGARGASPQRIARYVASELVGPGAFDGGGSMIVLGVVGHFAVALAIAATFWGLARRLRAPVEHPVIGGIGFGVAANVVMDHVVVPLSRAPAAAGAFSWAVLANGVLGHALLIGLPIALWAARSSRAPVTRR